MPDAATTEQTNRESDAASAEGFLRDAIAEDQRQSEVTVGWMQLAILLLFASLYAVGQRFLGGVTAFHPVPLALAGYFIFTVIRLRLAYRGRLREAHVILSIGIDMALLLGLIWSFHIQYRQPLAFSLKAPTFVYLFIFISLRALRLDPRTVIIAGGIAAAGWLFMVIDAVVAAPTGLGPTHDYVRYLTSNTILIGAEIDKVVTILVVTLILALAVGRGRRLLAGQIAEAHENKRLLTALTSSENRHALVLAGANDGIFDLDLAGGRLYFSPRAEDLLGRPHGALAFEPVALLPCVYPEDQPALDRAFDEAITAHNPHFLSETRMVRNDGSTLWAAIRAAIVYAEDGTPLRVTGSLGDISERKQYEKQLLKDAFYDRLTGLPNRALLFDRLRQRLTQRNGIGSNCLGVFLLNLDDFKTINDNHGHDTGDALLTAVARRIETLGRKADTVARLGGDEFVLAIDDLSDRTAATTFIKRIQDALAPPFDLGGQSIMVSASIGVALSGVPNIAPDDLLRDAGLALSLAKDDGRDRHAFFDPGMLASTSWRHTLEMELRRAVDRHEFEMFYQPIVDIASRRLAGFEALIRWNHPERGIVSPTEFIPVAEQTGLILPIGRWAIGEAAARLAAWRVPTLFVAVNVSTRQFDDGGDVVDAIRQSLAETALPPECLKIEVTESLMARNPETAMRILCALKRMGVRLAIDDFGTGYSSLSQIRRFPFDTLKIDRSFVCGINDGAKAASLVDAIHSVALRLDMSVVAEGIETETELSYLNGIHCRYGQGYLFAKPLPAAEAEHWLTA